MSNWRTTLKTFFADKVADALPNINKFGPWNSQTNNSESTEVFGPLAVFFEYSSIGDGLEYLKMTNLQSAERVPVEVTLHIIFNRYTEESQDAAYEYADLLNVAIAGQKHEYIVGVITKISEVEDANHAAQYDYQMKFAFQLKEVVDSNGMEDANEETTEDPNPDTGRKLKLNLTQVLGG